MKSNNIISNKSQIKLPVVRCYTIFKSKIRNKLNTHNKLCVKFCVEASIWRYDLERRGTTNN